MTRNQARPFDAEARAWLDKADGVVDDQLISKCATIAEKQLKDKSTLLALIRHLDLTTLNATDTRARVEALVDRAVQPAPGHDAVSVAAVCVYPTRVADVKNRLASKNCKTIHVASVAAGFPTGMYRLESKLLEVALAIKDGADEIDIVINRPAALEGDWQTVYDEIAELRKECGARAHMKTILAVGELVDHKLVYQASMVAMLAGSDFVKTSTGKESVNATFEYAYTMCAAIRDYEKLTGVKVGFKPAGGIATPAQAQTYKVLLNELLPFDEYTTSTHFRIGASSLLDNIVKML